VIIRLAGYNVEAELIDDLETAKPDMLTPETFSAAYARISRSTKDITTLRQQARKDIQKARKSNKKIIFDMGHHSVAEHAVFNFDIIGVSRLALEEIEQFRLVSFTEKSQRYVTLKGKFVLPFEIRDRESKELFFNTIRIQNQFYIKSYSKLKEYIFSQFPKLVKVKSQKNRLEGMAKEDARYILSLSTEGQVGITINARNLEHLFRRFVLSKRAEVKEIGKRMYEQVAKIAPSIFIFSDPSEFSRNLKGEFLENFKLNTRNDLINRIPKILSYTKNGDDIILASFLSVYSSINFNSAYKTIKAMDQANKQKIFKDLFKNMEFFDTTPREFEMVDLTFQAIISASCFAQLKRHRMATLLSGNYSPEFGNVIPLNIMHLGLQNEFQEVIEKTNQAYHIIKDKYGRTSDYILTNSHCLLVIMKMNLREFYHFIRLRDDEHAQWEIRQLAHHLLKPVKRVLPLSTLLLGGKSDFTELYESIYSKKPKFLI